MAGPTIYTSEPALITAGDTVTWTTSSSQFPASSGNTLKYYLNGPAGNPVAAPIVIENGVNGVTITQSGTTYTVTVPYSFTSTWAAGVYIRRRAFFIGIDRYTEDGCTVDGFLQVLADPTAAPAATHASRTLAKIEAALESLSTSTRTSVSIDGVSYTNSNLGELYRQRAMYRAEVMREQAVARAARGLPSVTRIVPAFVRHR